MNDSSPRTVLSQLCDLLAARPLQGLVYEEERPPRTAWGPMAPMLEFVSAQTGLPIVAVGGGAGLGRMPQVGGGRSATGWQSPEAICLCVTEYAGKNMKAVVPNVIFFSLSDSFKEKKVQKSEKSIQTPSLP